MFGTYDAFLCYECDSRAQLENIIQFSGYCGLFVTFRWLALVFHTHTKKAFNYLAL